jgi:hypothetical protein
MFSMIFQSLTGPKKSRCDIPNGTTQGCFYLTTMANSREKIVQYYVLLQDVVTLLKDA